MVPNDIWLRTEWLSCRRTSVLRCVERYCAAAAREYRRALRRVQEVEETMAQVEPETGRRLPSQPAQAELLNRRLAAANAEIRRYQTRLYACEREPAPQAAPPEPEEERCPFAQPDWKPTTALDHQAVDLVHQLESLMTV